MKGVLGIAFIAVLVSAAAASAMEVNLDVYPAEQTVKPYVTARYIATVETDIPDGGIYLYVTGKPSNWVNMGTSYIDLPVENGQIKIPIDFYPNDRQGSYTFTVSAQSMMYPENQESREITLRVLSPEKINLLDAGMDEDGKNAVVRLGLDVAGTEDVTADFAVTDSEGTTVATYTRTQTIEGPGEISQSVPLGGLNAGTYEVSASVKGTSIAFSDSFTIDPVRMVVKTEEAEESALFNEYRIKLKNDGNVVEDDYSVEASVPTGFVTFSQQPDSCEDGVCRWVIDALAPAEGMEIVYRIDYWPLVAEGLLIAILLGAFAVFGWNRINVPSISKRVEHGKSGSYTAVIEIRNAGRKITNVVVRDVVSPLFELERTFETIKPAIKSTGDGTELVWSLPAIEPGDHRIIHYKVRPVVNGHLMVPKAYMRYSLSNGKKSKVVSRQSFLAA